MKKVFVELTEQERDAVVGMLLGLKIRAEMGSGAWMSQVQRGMEVLRDARVHEPGAGDTHARRVARARSSQFELERATAEHDAAIQDLRRKCEHPSATPVSGPIDGCTEYLCDDCGKYFLRPS